MMKVSVDNATCEAHAQCYQVDPDLFTLDEDGYSNIGQRKDVPSGQEDLAQTDVDNCPVQALRIEEP